MATVELREWPDSSGEDDHGRDGGGSDSSASKSSERLAKMRAARERALKIQAVRKDKLEKRESSMRFINSNDIKEAVAKLAAGAKLDEMNKNLMGACWAALNGGYRGEKYEGADKVQATASLKAMYEAQSVEPNEADHAGGEFFEEALRKDDSFDSLRDKVSQAINRNIKLGIDMDCDGDGPQDSVEGSYAYVCDMFPMYAVYSMDNCLCQVEYAIDADGDCHLGEPTRVETIYTPVAAPAAQQDESFCESYSPLAESAYDSTKGELTITVIKPGLSKNNRFYGADMLKKSHKIFEGAKMFADHASDKEMKDRPEGSVNNWVANISKVWPESDGTIKATAVVIDPAFKSKLEALNGHGMLGQMGVSIRAVGEASDGEVGGKKAKIVESLVAARSVDFVTFAGAGGQVEAIQ